MIGKRKWVGQDDYFRIPLAPASDDFLIYLWKKFEGDPGKAMLWGSRYAANMVFMWEKGIG